MAQNQTSPTSEQLLYSLGTVLQTLREHNSVEVLIDTCLNYLQAEFDYHLIWIGLYDRLEHQLWGQGGVTPTEETNLLKQRFPLTSGDLLEQVVIQLQPLKIPDLRAESRARQWRNIAQSYNIQGAVLVPLKYQDRCVGITLLGSQQWGITPSRTEEELLSIILGELAAALHRVETEWYRQHAKRPDQPIFYLLSQPGQVNTLEQFLSAVVEQVHQFIEPSRTCIYWYSRQGRYFWRRISNAQKIPDSNRNRPASGITAQEFEDFYHALNDEQLVVIGEAYSSLNRDITQRIMQKMRVRSLLAAPIRLNQELQGFVAVEVYQPRLWQKSERNFLQGIAQLVEAITPGLNLEAQLDRLEQDYALITQMNWLINQEEDWRILLKTSANQLCQRLGVFRFLLLHWDQARNQFDILYQTPSLSRRLIQAPLPPLPEAEQQILKQQQLFALENWEDSQFPAWQEAFKMVGVRSLLITPMDTASHSAQISLKALLVIAHDAPRTWEQSEKILVRQMAQHLGLSLQQWQLIQRLQDQHQVMATLQSSWQLLQPSDRVDKLERHWLNQIARRLNRPWGGLICWSETETDGHLVVSELPNTICPLNSAITFDIKHESLVQQALSTDKLLHLKISSLSRETQQWLQCPGIEQITVMTLRTHPDHQPTAVMILPEPHPSAVYSEDSHYQLIQLVTQFAWVRRCHRVQHHLYNQREELKWLNWYKQRRLEEFYRIMGQGFKQLNDIAQYPKQNGNKSHNLASNLQSKLRENQHLKQLHPLPSASNQLTSLRYQQLLREIGNALASTTALIRHEQWQLQNNCDPIPVANLLRRVTQRMKPLLKHHQVQLHIHRAKHYDILGDRTKLDLILYELLLIACHRSFATSAIEIYVEAVSIHQIKIDIIDSGYINPRLIIDLSQGAATDILTPSTLDSPPGQHILICQQVVEQMGGEFSLKQNGPRQVITQLILPRVNS
ncbi:MAG: GAF domain-containing protein [Microcoleaceae cyanobacterium]